MTASRNPFILTVNHNNLITSQFVSTVTYKVIQKPFWIHLCGLVNVQHSNCYKHTMISLLCRFCNDYVSHVKNELGASSFPVKIDILRINKSSQKLLKHLIMSSFKMWMLLASHANSSPSTWAGGEGGRWGLGAGASQFTQNVFLFFFFFSAVGDWPMPPLGQLALVHSFYRWWPYVEAWMCMVLQNLLATI